MRLRDEGSRIILEPAAEDPITAAEGALADEVGRVDMRRLRAEARADEQQAERRRARP